MKATFAECCAIAEKCLPLSPFQDMLCQLHAEMLAEIDRLRADNENLHYGLHITQTALALAQSEIEANKPVAGLGVTRDDANETPKE